MDGRNSMQVALCGLLASLMIIVMLLGSIVPMAALLCPAIAALFLIPAIRECGMSTGISLYGATAVLSLILVPDKEVALLFTMFMGPIPLLRPLIDRISPRPLQIFIKLLACNLLLVLCYTILLLVFTPTGLGAELGSYTLGMLLILLFLFNLLFLFFDVSITKITYLYEFKLRNKLFHPKRNKK